MIDEDEVEVTYKRLHQNKTRNTGSVGKGHNFPSLPLLGTADSESAVASHLRSLSGDMESQQGGAYNQIFNFGSPQTHGGVFEPKSVDNILLS